MAPPPTLSSQPSQAGKTQKSISSFFTPKPAAGSVLSQKPTPQSTKQNGLGRGSGLFVSQDAPDEDEDEELPTRRLKRAISNIHGDSGDRGPSKRFRRSSEDVENAAPESETIASPTLNREDSTNSKRRSLQPAEKPTSPLSEAKTSERTSKYVFSQDADTPMADDDEDEQVKRQKERLHQKFVKKLGRPDSMTEIKRRNHFITEETEELDAENGLDAEEEDEPPKSTKGKKAGATKKGAAKLTPMEKQILDIKRKNMDTLLVVEVGYKYRFFGEDARIASKELQIMCIPGKIRYDEHPSEAHLDRFASASFPTHRLHVHVKRLVQAGYKVGVVRQLETAALKAVGDNRNTPFVRQLTNLYTKGTYIDDTEGLDGSDGVPSATTPSSGHLLCMTETNAKGWGTDEKVRIGFVAVQPTTGDVIYDDFEDGFMRSELETRLLHISPCEFLIVGNVSKTTEKLVSHLAASRTGKKAEQARIEKTDKPKTMAAQAYSHISSFYADKVKSSDDASSSTALLDRVHQLSELVTICLSAMINHLTAYGLEHVFDLTKYFQPFSARSHMLLNGNTLTSLEIYENQTDHTSAGSLFWTLDKTQTRFGQRLLRKWVGRPLLDQARLTERVEAVEELMQNEGSLASDKLRRLLRQIKGDLEKSLIRIYYKKCTRSELLAVLQTLQTIANEYVQVSNPEDSGFKSPLLGQAIASLPCILDDVVSYLDRINLGAAKDNDKYNFFRQEHETEAICDHKVGIVSIEHDLEEHKKKIAEALRKKKVDYVTSSAIEFLIEVDNTQLKNVPASWAKISGTKKLSRFHTPEVIKLIRERDQHKEALANACDEAFADLLTEIGTNYQSFRDCIQSLASLDCLLSLAEVSSLPGYSKPEFITDETRIEVSGGRHPMVEQLLLDTYVPNDISLSSASTRALLVTGPNMGGKSSHVRSVALISIMAQIGCFVPATSARLSLLDAIFTRMGAEDNMMKGESTFMVELSETSDILKQATPRSLVILDELGRGTSTHDGVAIAQAVLDFMLRECKSLTLFITHYQALARMAEQWPGGELRNVHMKFTESEGGNGEKEVTFLYEVGEGTAHRSYGLNVARLAGLPGGILEVAQVKSKELEVEEMRRRLAYLGKMMPNVLQGEGEGVEELVGAVEQLG
ncbi:DNA mismatch repair protein MSH3 [Elsinoe australis]|uniref:MutS protein homolog 3 n=1 Tax=Elsinoe australis TaxID=40998 RepID=A0A4U7B928_9PEZI|nr:DNA mismatch repair protein MSH3 [Elsinoe australis]